MTNRAYAMLEIKSVSEDLRVIKGMATTPTPDRMGDIVEPMGVKFNNPMPLLWQHKHDKPVGWVRFLPPTEKGIEFEAKIARVEEAGSLKERVDEAWQSVKMGLVRAVSIGFKALEYAFMKESDGIHFIKTEVLELSLVTIPAQSEATISDIKSLDYLSLAASGLVLKGCERPVKPGVTGQQVLSKGKTMPKTIKERIAAFEASRAAKAARMAELIEGDGDELATLDKEQSQEYDTLKQEVRNIDEHLVRLNEMDKENTAKAQPVDGKPSTALVPAAAAPPLAPQLAASSALTSPERVRVTGVRANLPPGQRFIRLAMALAYGRGDTMRSLARAKEWQGDCPEISTIIEAGVGRLMDGVKAAVGAGTTTDATWASPLVTYQVMADEFAGLLRPLTIIGRIPGLRRVPFNIQLPATTTGSSVNWVGENAPKPVTKMDFTTITLRWAKAAGIIVLTDELVRFSNPSAEAVVRQDIIDAMTQFLDRQFVDPTVAEVTNVSPASITNGVSPVTPTGTNEAAFRTDVRTLLNTFLTNNLSPSGGVWIMTQQQRLAFSLMINALGQPSFPTAQNGELLGYPIVDSEGVPATGGSPVDGYPIIFAKASEIMLADDGQTVIDASNQASVQMDSTPDSPPSASTVLVSLWQNNLTGIRAERWINWKKRRSTAVQFIQNAKYA